MINYFSRYVFSYHISYYGSYLDAFIFQSVLLEEVELYSKQLTYLDEKGRNFFHNFIYNLSLVSSYNSNNFNWLRESQSKVCNESSVSN